MDALTRPDGSPLRVLVVDDEQNIAELISMALRYEGWETSQAHTGSKAVAAAKDFRPDAVVLDMMLPDFDGMEVLRRVRGFSPDVPVVFLTARGQAGHPVLDGVAGGEEEHGYVGVGRAHPAQHLEPVEVGEHHVEHDRIGGEGLRGRHGLGAGMGRSDLEPLVAQGHADQLGDVLLVVHHEHAER